MIIHKELRGTIEHKGLLDIYIPLALPGSNWKNWKAVLDLKTCEGCRSNHGKIYASIETKTVICQTLRAESGLRPI